MLTWRKSKQKCKNCGKIFITKKKNHLYCCRKCYLTVYNKKEKNKELPKFKCPNCNKIRNLTFNPILKPLLWANYKCKCGWINKDNDFRIILNIKKNWKKFNMLEKKRN